MSFVCIHLLFKHVLSPAPLCSILQMWALTSLFWSSKLEESTAQRSHRIPGLGMSRGYTRWAPNPQPRVKSTPLYRLWAGSLGCMVLSWLCYYGLVTVGRPFPFPGPQFPHLYNGKQLPLPADLIGPMSYMPYIKWNSFLKQGSWQVAQGWLGFSGRSRGVDKHLDIVTTHTKYDHSLGQLFPLD